MTLGVKRPQPITRGKKLSKCHIEELVKNYAKFQSPTVFRSQVSEEDDFG